MDKKEIIIIVTACIGGLLQAYFANITPIILPQMAKVFGLSNILQNWVTNIFILTMGVCALPLSKVASKYGVKRTFYWSLIFTLVGTIGTIFANSIFLLFLFRIIQGIGGGGLCVASVLIISESLPEKIWGKVFGLYLALVYIGVSLTTVIGGVLSYHLGWTFSFYLFIPLIIINIILLYFIKDEWVLDAEERFDLKGSVIYAIAFSVLIFGFSILNTIIGLIVTIIGVLCFVLFGKLELKISNPVFDMNLFKDNMFLSGNITSILSFLATFVVTTLVNYNLQYIQGYNSITAGLVILVLPFMMVIFAPIAGLFTNKIDDEIVSALGMGIVTVGLFLLIFLDKSTSLSYIFLSLFLQGVGFGLFATSNMNIIMCNVPDKDNPMASSAIAAMRIVGQTGSMGILTVVFALVMGDVMIIPSNYPALISSTQITMLIVTIVGVLTVLVSLWGLKSKNKIDI